MPLFLDAQNNEISIKAVVLQDYKIQIDQEITYLNPSDHVMDTIYLLNWANSAQKLLFFNTIGYSQIVYNLIISTIGYLKSMCTRE